MSGNGKQVSTTTRICDHCGASYAPARRAQRFCSRKCNDARKALLRSIGGALMPMLVKWRKSRGQDRDATFGAWCAELDAKIQEHRL